MERTTTTAFTDQELTDFVASATRKDSSRAASLDLGALAEEALMLRDALRAIAGSAHLPRWERNDHGIPVPVCEPTCPVCIAQRHLDALAAACGCPLDAARL